MQSRLFIARGSNAIPQSFSSFGKIGATSRRLWKRGIKVLRTGRLELKYPSLNIHNVKLSRARELRFSFDAKKPRSITTVSVSRNDSTVATQNDRGGHISGTSSATLYGIPMSKPKVRFSGSKFDVRYGGLSTGLKSRAGQMPVLATWKVSYPSQRHRNTLPPPSHSFLSLVLDSKSSSDRHKLLQEIDPLDDSWAFRLSTIFSRYLAEIENFKTHSDVLATILNDQATRTLQNSGFSPEDLSSWAEILNTSNHDEAAQRYLSSSTKKPTFLLLTILHSGQLSVSTLRALLLHCFEDLLGIAPKDFLSKTERDAQNPSLAQSTSGTPALRNVCISNLKVLEESTFRVLISRLLKHARKAWAPAVISIAHMVVIYCDILVRKLSPHNNVLNTRLLAKLSNIYNITLRLLSLPASRIPMRSMEYNWQAQRVLLKSAGLFQPPLQLDKASYRAVFRVLTASKKTDHESKYTSLVQRAWPPWRREQDGMDIERSPEEDISRVTAAISRMMEAGYAEDSVDKAFKILSGREPDGTPTIQTRYLVKARGTYNRVAQGQSELEPSTAEWAARIIATRDVHEAWSAFLAFSTSQRRPSLQVYQALFEKLIFQSVGKNRVQDSLALPGDGKEVMPVHNDNISESERLRIQPPTIEELYAQMIRDGIRPSGRCLDMLIARSPTVELAVRCLRDSDLNPIAVSNLLGPPQQTNRSVLDGIPESAFVAFIRFLSTVRVQRIPLSPTKSLREKSSGDAMQLRRLKKSPLLHAFELMKCRRSSSQSAWYAIFSALAREGMQVDHQMNQPVNDIMTWRLLEAALFDSRNNGVWLDPLGFQIVCIGLEKALLASFHLPAEKATLVQSGQRIVREAFAKLSESVQAVYGLPRLLYGIGGAHLHAYIRVLGISHDQEEILVVLRWMVKHQDDLVAGAQDSKTGIRHLRRSLIAIRAFIDHADDMDAEVIGSLKELMSQLTELGGWPTDQEVNDYLAKSRHVGDPIDVQVHANR